MMRTLMVRFVLFVLVVMGLLTACQSNRVKTASLPVGKAYADGKDIFFTHTEASDPEIATKLTKMMNSPVLLVPSLAETPDNALANVYVFSNGIKGKGPLGFQGDVFDNPPGSVGYSPLRRLNVVTWSDPANARILKSSDEVQTAEKAGELTIAQPGVVINMPFVVWDGGKR